MKRSTERILTTHTGSLPRPDDLLEMMRARESRQPFDQQALVTRVRSAVAEVVGRQTDIGIDIISDGEQGKAGFTAYVAERLSGFRPGPVSEIHHRDLEDFPEYAREARGGRPGTRRADVCLEPIGWQGAKALRVDIENFQQSLRGVQVEEAFMPSAAPGVILHDRPNEYYPSEREYIYALAVAMKEEYRAITDAGLLLQLDSPDIPDDWHRILVGVSDFSDVSIEEYRRMIALRVEAINHALEGIPPERVRLHVCWGNYEGPHHRDIPLRDIVDLMLNVNAGAYAVEASNPRHAHEWKVWRDVKLPEGKVLIPGVIDTTTNFIEHPELVAERIVRFAEVVGRENVIAGTDCGFGTTAGSRRVHPSIAWAKLGALAEGARLATQQLWR